MQKEVHLESAVYNKDPVVQKVVFLPGVFVLRSVEESQNKFH